ncbi:MAG: hypothetical protein HRU28_06915 [Rhizobiales bacterium]|nr:hypothetical protein [Hyphomicrobiales bacterium]
MSNISLSILQNEDAFFVKLAYRLLYVAILLSGFVLFEPAPFDLLILLTIFIILFNGFVFPIQIKWVFVIAFVHLVGNFISVLVSTRFADSYMHMIITTYMILFAIGIIIMVYNDPYKILDIIMKAYVWAALISTILAIMGYFHIGPTYDLFTLYGRAKGGFKDPNVFGPFIVPPMLYLVDRIIHSDLKKKIVPIMMISVLFLGLLLSFSRGAWGMFFFSTLFLIVTMYYTSKTNRFRVELTLYILIALTILAIGLLIAINIPAIANLLSERASLTQSYDVEEGGRFTHHVDAFKILIENPWGIGAKEFGWSHGEDVHNSYLTAFLIGGWLGGFTFLLIILSTVIVGFKYCFNQHTLRRQFVFFYAAFLGLMVEAWIIDVDHWRILYIAMGYMWGIILYQKYHPKSQNKIHSLY